MIGDPDRAAAAKACQRLLEICRRDDDIRRAVVHAYAAKGYESIYDMASHQPADVVALAEELESLEEQSQ